jgi:hypothetical protein
MFQCNQVRLYPVQVYADASDDACAAYSHNLDQSIVYRAWTDMESLQSSTWRELKCIEWGLKSLSKLLRNKTVQWFTEC